MSGGESSSAPAGRRTSAFRDVAGALIGRFRADWRRVPQGDRRAWWRVILAGAAVLVVLMLGLVWLTRRMADAGSLDAEAGALSWLGEHGPLGFSTAVWVQTFGTDITLWFVIVGVASAAVWLHKPITAATIVLAYAVFDPIVRLGWLTWDRARPDVLWNGVAAPAFHSFPSGHAGKTVAVYGVLFALWIAAARGWGERIVAASLYLVIVLLVPIGRLTMGVHWPSDVIAGVLLGFVWLGFLLRALRYELPRDVSRPARSPSKRRAPPTPAPHASPGSPLP